MPSRCPVGRWRSTPGSPVTRDEAGLAAVLGHEVAHVLARHSAERISRQLALQLGVEWLGTAAGVNPQLTQAGAPSS